MNYERLCHLNHSFYRANITTVILQSSIMLQCYINVKDMQLAYRIDAILNTGTNIQLLGDGYKEGLY